MPDVQFENHGSIWLARPLTLAAHAWIAENVADEGEDMAQWFGGALVVEPRYGAPLVEAMRADGLGVAG